jgi:hypothetical protein
MNVLEMKSSINQIKTSVEIITNRLSIKQKNEYQRLKADELRLVPVERGRWWEKWVGE